MERTSRRWMIVCLSAVLAAGILPVGVLGADEPAPTEPTTPVAPAPPIDPMAILKVIPADATAFVAVRSLKELDGDVTAVADRLQFPLASFGFPGLVGLFKEGAQITDGLNENGGLAAVLLSCARLEGTEGMLTRQVVLIPCTNPDALTAGMNPEKDEESGLLKIDLFGSPWLAAPKDNYLVVGPSAETVTEVLRNQEGGVDKTMSSDRVENYMTQDIFAWANCRQISPAVRNEVVNVLKGLMMMGAMVNPGADAEAAAAQVENSLAQLIQLFDDSQEFSIGVNLDAKVGLKLVFYARMKEDSELGRQMAATKLPTEPLLLGLPDESVIAVFAGVGNVNNELAVKQLRTSLDQALNEDVLGKVIDPEKLKSLKESLITLAPSVEQLAMSVSALPPGNDDGMVGVTIVTKVANGQRVQEETRKLFGIVKEMVLKVALDEGTLDEDLAEKVKQAVQLKENAEQLAGCNVDHFTFDLAAIPDLAETPAAPPEETPGEEGGTEETLPKTKSELDRIKSVIGQEGVLIRMGTVDDKHLVVTFGGGKARFAQVAELTRKGEAPLAKSKPIMALAEILPTKNRTGEGYFYVDHLLSLLMDVGQKIEQPMPIPIMMSEDVTPIALAVTQVDKTAVQGDLLLLPMDLAETAMNMVRPFLGMMLMGGMGGGEEMDEEGSAEPPTIIPAPAQ